MTVQNKTKVPELLSLHNRVPVILISASISTFPRLFHSDHWQGRRIKVNIMLHRVPLSTSTPATTRIDPLRMRQRLVAVCTSYQQGLRPPGGEVRNCCVRLRLRVRAWVRQLLPIPSGYSKLHTELRRHISRSHVFLLDLL